MEKKYFDFVVGLVEDCCKKSEEFLNTYKMSYCECKNGLGFDTIVRGG